MIIIMNLIYGLGIILAVIFVYYDFISSSKMKNRLIFGVTIPSSAKDDPEIIEIIDKEKKNDYFIYNHSSSIHHFLY